MIDILNKREKIYKKNIPKIEDIHPIIALAIIVDNADNNEIRISSILNDKCNAGKILNLDIIALTAILNRIEKKGYIEINRTAGLDVIKLSDTIKGKTRNERFLWCINEYYRILNN